eukprot:152609-Chlamydomonas_euryale.AAC.1
MTGAFYGWRAEVAAGMARLDVRWRGSFLGGGCCGWHGSPRCALAKELFGCEKVLQLAWLASMCAGKGAV